MELEIVKIYIALLVLVNPIGAIPIFIGLTSGTSHLEQKKIAKISATAVAIILLTCSLIGELLLKFLGISIGAFQVGGGLLVLLIAIGLMNAKPPETKTSKAEQTEAANKANIAVVPMAMPLMTGPGSISTVIIYASNASTWLKMAYLMGGCLMVAGTSYLALSLAGPLSRLLGQTGINIVNRVMGMLLSALSIEIIADGLRQLFPHLMR